MPLYRITSERGYELVKSNQDEKFHYTHWAVANETLQNEIAKGLRVVHLCNFNKRDNTPSNLKMMSWLAHTRLHAALANGFIGWNGTEAQRERARKVVLAMHRNNPGWNLAGVSKGGQVSQANARKDPAKKQRMMSGLLLGHSPEARKKAQESLKAIHQLPAYRKKLSDANRKNWQNRSNEMRWRYSEMGVALGTRSGRDKIVAFAKALLSSGLAITEDNWNQQRMTIRRRNTPRFNSISKYFSGTKELSAVVANNHQLVNMKDVPETSDVYCLTVEKWHNFALDTGVFVHNCTANAIVAAHMFGQKKQGAVEIVTLSRLFVYWNERNMEGTVGVDSGAMIRDGMKSIADLGSCHETKWPYDIVKFRDKPGDDCFTDALEHQAVTYYRVGQDMREMKGCLASGYPFVFGFTVYESFESQQVALTGALGMPQKGERNLGGHAVMCVGYDDSSKTFLVQNSWGADWGQQGFFTTPQEYLANSDLAADFWTIRLVEA